MRVRVYDPALKTCFRATLYALFDTGVFERCLILREGVLRCVPRLLRSPPDGPYETQVSFIDPELPEDWISLKNGGLADFPDFPKTLPEDKWTAFSGYPWVWEDRETVRAVLSGKAVPLADARFAGRPLPDDLPPGWREVSTPEQAEELLRQAEDFHDAVLVEARYVSGSRQTEGGTLCADHVRQVGMLFHSPWCAPLELVFEAVKAFDLRPAGSGHSSNLFSATLRVRDAAVFFCDGDCADETAYPGTKILAYALRWRFLPPRSDHNIQEKEPHI